MSPPPATSGRYHSQLLNFLNRQGQRLRDQSELWLRQLKLTTLWGGQIALYPIYAVFQAARIAARQLGTQMQRVLHQLRPVPAVPADRAILQVLQSLDDPAIGHPNIQAIASSLATRQLVLITDQQAQLDCLTLDQQQPIQHRIVAELATYWQLWRRWQRHCAIRQLPTAATRSAAIAPLGDQSHLAAPARLCYQLMAWMQHSTLAHQLNWFDETQYGSSPPDWFQPHLGQLPIDALIRLDGVTNFDWRSWAQSARSEQHPVYRPLALWLQAAIRYFFGRSWPSLPAATAMPELAATHHRAQIAPATHRMPQLALVSEPPQIADRTWANVFANDRATTWIDTTATPIGYVQHPLERVLSWLDQALLWCETQADRLREWFQSAHQR
jgi:hypothetical protein